MLFEPVFGIHSIVIYLFINLFRFFAAPQDMYHFTESVDLEILYCCHRAFSLFQFILHQLMHT